MLSCKDQRLCTVFGCSECGHIKRVPFTCRSRFCPSCGALYHSQRTSSMSEKLLKLPHRHCIFTIPEDLRNYFLQNRSLLNLLFESAYEAYSAVLCDVINGHRRRAGRKEIDCKTGLCRRNVIPVSEDAYPGHSRTELPVKSCHNYRSGGPLDYN